MKINRPKVVKTPLQVGTVFTGSSSGDYYLICKDDACGSYKLVNLSRNQIISKKYGKIEEIEEFIFIDEIFPGNSVELSFSS